MTTLTAENYIDLRETVQRRISELKAAEPGQEAQVERDRKVQSLFTSLERIEETAKDLIFEEAGIGSDKLVRVTCDHCFWTGVAGDLKDVLLGVTKKVLIETCPKCGGHDLHKLEKESA
jgi:hypothetical protein